MLRFSMNIPNANFWGGVSLLKGRWFGYVIIVGSWLRNDVEQVIQMMWYSRWSYSPC